MPDLPYGSWPSPFSAERIAAGARPLGATAIDGVDIYWLEGRATEGGRLALMRARPGAAPEMLTPEPFNLRSRVHEYGGGAFAVAAGDVVFSNFVDQRVYRQRGAGAAVAITPDSPRRHADFQFDRQRDRVIAVQEDHATAGQEPRNTLVALALDGGQGPVELHSGFDFYSSPRLSPDGQSLAWLCWNHPDMPWDGTQLWVAAIDPQGLLRQPHCVAGGSGEALCQPRWRADGTLYVVSDHSGWWNLYKVGAGGLQALCPMQAECGEPMWQFGQSRWDFSGSHSAVVAPLVNGQSALLQVDLRDGSTRPLTLPFTSIDELRATDGFVVCRAGSPTQPQQLLRVNLQSGCFDVLARSFDEMPAPGCVSQPQTLIYRSAGRDAHAHFYPPMNVEFQAPGATLPPLLLVSHGGPTALSESILKLSVQYWTSRGFAVLDVNYGGSSGYGRAYRRLLDGQWGIVDVEDCVAGARFVASQGWVDPQRMAIRGGSASGFTTLCALIFHDVFKAGASFYGVADLAALDADTHKFESRYTQRLICAPQDRARVYAERSPIAHVQRLNRPMIFLQGLDDRVVPPAQSRTMVQALRQRGVPVAYVEFEGEGHGFRKPQTQRRALEAELAFYAFVFGFVPADPIEALDFG